ncbi:MAG: hypothetical protein C0474_04310 [Sphingobium sp.]|nr:hypothetical protein [Sphingobium sp.]
MEGASRTILSQPLAALAPKTASGGKIRARRFAPAWRADKPLYRFGKIRRRAQTRVGARILANTIGVLVSDALAGSNQQNDSESVKPTGASQSDVEKLDAFGIAYTHGADGKIQVVPRAQLEEIAKARSLSIGYDVAGVSGAASVRTVDGAN